MPIKLEPIRKYHYIMLPAYWQGRTAYLEDVPRANNPYPENHSNRLAWFVGWDDEDEDWNAFPCEHDWEPDENGKYCLICGARK